MNTDKIRPPGQPAASEDPFSTLTDGTVAVRGRVALESAWTQVRVQWSRLTRVQQLLTAGCIVFACLLLQANAFKLAHRVAHWARGDSAIADQKVLTLLECPVCHQPVDPKTAQFIADVGKKHIYFDRMECLEAFQANPRRYAHVKYHVRVTPNEAAGDALPLTRIPPPPDATDDQPPPTAVDAGSDSADAPPSINQTARAGKNRGPVGDAPLELPPDPPPAQGPNPVTESVSGAPSVDEPPPRSDDVPQRAPAHLPDYDSDGAAAAAHQKHRSAPTPRLDSMPDNTVPPPPRAKDMPPPDDNGFALPPDAGEAPPATRRSKRSHPSRPSSDAPPSADEPQP